MCDTVEGRQSVIKCTYTKKYKTKQWDGSYKIGRASCRERV